MHLHEDRPSHAIAADRLIGAREAAQAARDAPADGARRVVSSGDTSRTGAPHAIA
jgi:hypothetical protein